MLDERSPRAAGGEVLVVDDAPANRFLYTAILEDDGHRVREAADGSAALTMIAAAAPPIELVLLDVSMPGMDGIEVLRRVRARGDGGPALLIHTSAARTPDAIERGLELGADAYLIRPVDNRELAARVRAALQIQRLNAVAEGRDDSMQLWALPAHGKPRSLGVLESSGKTLRLSVEEQSMAGALHLAISVEGKGGSATGSGPSLPFLFKGAAVQKAL